MSDDNPVEGRSTPNGTIARAEWSGPLPPPSVLREFDETVENGAERIVAAWERESEHRRVIERERLRVLARDAIVGKTLAFGFVIAALTTCAFAVASGAEWVAAILGGGVIGTVVWAFIRTDRDPE